MVNSFIRPAVHGWGWKLRLYIIPLLILGLSSDILVQAKLACTTTEFCETTLRPGSQCVNGFCDNPFQYGCLQSQMEGFEKLRVCHSEDPPDAASRGLCRDALSTMNYPEIRILSQNWESPFFEAWVLQILLSEVLDVPTTIETGTSDLNINFYDPEGRFDYGIGYYMEGLDRAAEVIDCRNVNKGKGENYKGCAHAILEIWSGQDDVIEDLLEREAVEPKSFIGLIGEEGWQLPKITAQRDPSLMSWFGLAGEKNRRKLADRFLRPTNWADYCSDVSPNGCLGGNDTVAARPPETNLESESYFVEGLYTGHFRKTELNDCDKWPDNCTGHYMDYPCGWDSFFVQQAYHLNIALQSNGQEPGANGYSYEKMVQIWYAANWTKSDIIGWWWKPEALYLQFLGTDFEMQRIVLPPTNYKCIANRMSSTVRCGDDDALRVGNREGSCDVPPIPNYKLLSTGLYKMIYDPSIPEALRSPGYELLKEYTLDTFILGKIFEYWTSTGIDKYGYDPRYAVCKWVSENLEDLLRFVPRSYPRVIEEKEDVKGNDVAIGLACAATLVSLVSVGVTYRQRKKRSFQFAQVEFVFLLLLGLVLVSVAALLTVLPPTNVSCITIAWLLNVGYTLELVPLVVKIAAINRLMHAALRMKRIKLSRNFLLGVVASFMGLVAIYLTLWTILDPPIKTGSYALTEQVTEDGSTVIEVSYYCESSSEWWMIISVGIQTLLLLAASILAFLTRKMRGDVNETNTISFLIYWNFVCILLRVILIMLGGSIDVAILNRSLSIILSVDSMATILIYFIPKFIGKDPARSGSSNTTRGGNHYTDGSNTNNNSEITFNGNPFPAPIPSYRGVAGHRVSFSGHVSVMNQSDFQVGSTIKSESSRDLGNSDAYEEECITAATDIAGSPESSSDVAAESLELQHESLVEHDQETGNGIVEKGDDENGN